MLTDRCFRGHKLTYLSLFVSPYHIFLSSGICLFKVNLDPKAFRSPSPPLVWTSKQRGIIPVCHVLLPFPPTPSPPPLRSPIHQSPSPFLPPTDPVFPLSFFFCALLRSIVYPIAFKRGRRPPAAAAHRPGNPLRKKTIPSRSFVG
ncbi:hypothetical protein QBC41DRAFT_66751 [Cercophora samala]|uniref:Uncharacterized protein n=1 Tax=Cercophora samala TaxID=330535 RepID=A0AA39ZGZ9_9PEZI|nr:hypothetical protein QBC41DRAFT_66751 [Cercophora samala]